MHSTAELRSPALARTIEQSADFPRVPPELLFDLYLDAKKHSEAVRGPVEMVPEVGGTFAALGGLRGRNLLIEPKHLIVQSWRASVWEPDEADSILVLMFRRTEGGARVHLVQSNVPDRVYDTIHHGWRRHYWDRWAEYLNARQV